MEYYDLSKFSGKKFSEIKNGPVTNRSRRSLRMLSFILSSFLFISGTSVAIAKGIRTSKEYDENITSKNIDELYGAIKSNPNLDEKEKDIILNMDEFFEDYYEFIDYDTACRQLSEFDIEYKKYGDDYINTAGQWNSHFHTMDIFTRDGKTVSLENNPIATHELLHLISIDGSYYPNALEEGVDSLIVSEYFNYFDTYSRQRIITSMLCEIVSPEVVIKSYLRKDYSLIENELYKINPDRFLSYSLKSLLDQYQNIYENSKSLYNRDLSEYEKNKANMYFENERVIINSINEILCDYYAKKTGMKVSSSYHVNFIYLNLPLLNDGEGYYFDIYNNIYSSIFSIYSTMLVSSSYTLSENSYIYRKQDNIKTGYFNKDNNSNEVIIGNHLVVDTINNKVKKI